MYLKGVIFNFFYKKVDQPMGKYIYNLEKNFYYLKWAFDYST